MARLTAEHLIARSNRADEVQRRMMLVVAASR
jgi:hypothetical protein